VNDIKKLNSNFDAIVCRNLPKFSTLNHTTLKAAKCLAMSVAYIVGEPFQYLQQNNGEIVAEIKPVCSLHNTQSSSGKIEFGWHTDDCFFKPKFRTKYVALHGYYNPDMIQTNVAFIDDIIKHLSNNVLSVLMSKRFKVRVPISICADENYTNPIALIRINGEQQYEIGVPTFDVIPSMQGDDEAALAINELVSVLNGHGNSYCITDDTIFIFNNDRVIHARDKILKDRLIFRTYVRSNLDELRAQTETDNKTHVFNADYLIDGKL
jgi:hypothetical protein